MKLCTQGSARAFLLTAVCSIVIIQSAYSAGKAVGKTNTPVKRTGAVKATIVDLGAVSEAKMLAATADKQNTVYIKWILDNRWLPAQGFNLYRKGPGDTEFKKIAGPIKESSLGKISLKGLDGAAKQVDLGLLQVSAKKPVTIPAEMGQIFKVNPVKAQSSKPVFDELKILKQKQFSPYTASTRLTFDRFEPTSFTKLNAYSQRFNAAQVMIPRGAAKTKGSMKSGTDLTVIGKEIIDRKNIGKEILNKESTKEKTTVMSAKVPSPAIAVMDARQKLMLGSLVNSQINSALGLGYIDTNVKTGSTYEYKLREIADDGTESNISAASLPLELIPSLSSQPDSMQFKEA